FTLNQPGNDVNFFAADLNTGSIVFNDTDSVDIATVGATGGILTGNPGTGGSVTITSGGLLTVSQPISTAQPSDATATGSISLIGSVQVNNTVTSGGGNVSLTGTISANSDLTVNAALTSGGDLTLSAPRDAFINAVIATIGTNADITIIADSDVSGSGGVLVTATGGVSAIATVALRGSSGVSATFNNNGVGTGVGFTLPAPLTTVAVQIDSDGTNSQISSTGASVVIDTHAATTGSDIVINGRISTTTNGGTLLVTADSQLSLGVNGDLLTDGAVTLTAAGGIDTAGDITTTGDAIDLLNNLVLTGNVVISSGPGSGNISFAGSISGTTTLTEDISITAGTGSINFIGNVGLPTAVGDMTIVSAADVKFTGSLNADSFTQQAGTGDTL
ncbi:MAG: beta strand repeat-containing protein, partial [Planctomyces sp.]